MNYTLEIQEDHNGNYFIELPNEMIEELGWKEGDILEWKLKGQGVILSKLNDPTGYETIEE
ncbi:AbrB/MazE/SpoVT family DNA-binding domain-containing protein [Dolichospermum sp. ST_sed3]|nr:AbrB/MazE/SpoVT family DNA-binding domain-containing protein [Dolichospermum sp. ST_sed3]